MSNSLGPNQVPHLFGSGLDSNCFKRFSADEACMQRVNFLDAS